ncbi:sensor histidine kinase [Nonomuraea endophytica]|uniref:sensor histidine kinase n=1 Tax=Nonomuraea endophytica TaxID=714136 RepID=UPI0037C826D3
MSLRLKIALSLALTAVAVATAIGILVHLRTADTQLDTARRTLDAQFQSLLARQAEGQDAGLTVGPVPAPLSREITTRPVRATYLDGDTLWAATTLDGKTVSLTRSYHPEQAQLAALDRTLLTSGALATLVACLAGIAVATGLSRRLRHVSRTATTIASGDLTARVSPPFATPPAAPAPPFVTPPTAPAPLFATPPTAPSSALVAPAVAPSPPPATPSTALVAPPTTHSTPDRLASAPPPTSSPPLVDSSAPRSPSSAPRSPSSAPRSLSSAPPPSGQPVVSVSAGRTRRAWRGDEVVAVGRALDRMADALQARLEAERRVTADIAHELRTPVTGLLTAAELLPPGRPTELVRDRAAVLAKLVEDILEVARLDTHTEQPTLERRRLSALTRRAITAANAHASPLPTPSTSTPDHTAPEHARSSTPDNDTPNPDTPTPPPEHGHTHPNDGTLPEPASPTSTTLSGAASPTSTALPETASPASGGPGGAHPRAASQATATSADTLPEATSQATATSADALPEAASQAAAALPGMDYPVSGGGGVRLVVVRDVEVETDPRRVERILANLVANAMRHGRPPVTVTVDGATVRVEDHGQGFPADMLAVLREHGPQRFASGASARGTGVGLGLTIAAGQARMLGADLEFGNTETGAAVTLRLPGTSSHHR